MATTKTLTPTNQAITLAEFTEKPDNRTNVTNDDKLADAVNALNSNLAALTNLYHSTGLHINETGTLTEDVTNYHFALFHFQTNSEHAYQLIPTDNLVGQMIHQTIVGARDNGEITYPPNYNASTNVRLTTTTTVICGMEIYNNVNFKCNLKDIYGVWRK